MEEAPAAVTDDHDWADASQASVADQDYLDQLDPPTDAELAARKAPETTARGGLRFPPAGEGSKLHVVGTISNEDAEEAARQAWIESGQALSSQQVADLAGLSKSTAHRRISSWKNETRRIVR